MRRSPAIGVAAAVAVAAAGCARRGGPPPERFVPADALAAVIVPRLDAAAPQLAALLETSGAFPGAGGLADARAAATTQLGFDPLDRKALAGAGIDPARGAALALRARPGGGRTVLLVLPVHDPEALDGVVARLARDRLGAGERSAVRRGAVEAAVFHAPGGPPALARVVVDGSAIVAAGPSAPDAVLDAAALPAAASLQSAAAWSTARGALGDGPAAVAWLPAGSPLAARAPVLRDGAALGIAGASDRLRVTAAILLGAREASIRALAAPSAAALPGALDPDAALVATWRGDPAALGRRLLDALPPAARARLDALGADPERDLAQAAAPGAAIALALAPRVDVAGLSEARVREDPLRLVRFEAVVPLRDPARVRAASARLAPPPAPRRGRRAAPADGTFRIATPSGEIAWRVDGDRLLVAGGAPGALDALAARVASGGGFRPPTAAAAAALGAGLGGAVLDVPRLVASIRALPEDAYGTGPNAFVMRSVVERFVDPAARLRAASLRADLAPGALVLGLDVEAASEEARRP